MTTPRFDFFLCHMGDDVRMFLCEADAIDFAVHGEPTIDNMRRRYMGENSYIAYVNPEERLFEDVTEDLARKWQADNPHETDIPTVFEPYVEPLDLSVTDRQEHGTYYRGIGL